MTSRVSYMGHLRTECTHVKSDKTIITDAPTDNHGKGECFSPTDLAATSLATCMITVMGIKAKSSNIPFSDIHANVKKVMAANPRRISEIQVQLYINEGWNEKQKKIMENIARSCPVSLSLNPNIRQNITFYYERIIDKD